MSEYRPMSVKSRTTSGNTDIKSRLSSLLATVQLLGDGAAVADNDVKFLKKLQLLFLIRK